MKIPQESELIFYQTKDNTVKIDVFFLNETFWMTQKKMAKLFGVQRPAISKHIKNIFSSAELEPESVGSILELTADDGKIYNTTFYNLDMIIAVGYRVNSKAATHFRIWATQTLKEFIVKGFVANGKTHISLIGGTIQTHRLSCRPQILLAKSKRTRDSYRGPQQLSERCRRLGIRCGGRARFQLSILNA